MVEPGSAERDVARLLRFLGNGGGRRLAGEGACRLVRPDGRTAEAAPAVISAMVGSGLALLRGDRLIPTREARAWLRRFLADREEAFLDQHRLVELTEIGAGAERETVRLNATATPLAALARSRDRSGAPWLTVEALAAGERLARDFHYAALQPRVTQSYGPRTADKPRAGTVADLSDSVVAARLRVAAAADAMGPDLSGVALDVCCFEKGLETVERERAWPARSAKLMLRTALLLLDRHYNPPQPPRKPRRHAWGADGYRPELAVRS
jgi:hypothetical protein